MQIDSKYSAAEGRYRDMAYRRCGRSGLTLPAISLGLWHNFGEITPLATQREICRRAFDLGITHFDLANNYGPPYGEAERNFGTILRRDFAPYRDELVISTKAGWDMWPGPYGDGGSKKYLVASLNQSLERLGLDYVDVFYHHRPDPNTPLEETLGALDLLVRQGKALYVGISQYSADLTRQAVEIFRQMGTPFVLHQPRYNMFDRWIEDGLLDVLEEEGVGCIVFSPLAQGLLSGKYLDGVPEGSRIGKDPRYLTPEALTRAVNGKVRKLASLATRRKQTVAQLALSWTLRHDTVTSALVGVSRPEQLDANVAALDNLYFSPEDLAEIEGILRE